MYSPLRSAAASIVLGEIGGADTAPLGEAKGDDL
jgi:hypothetical protein